MNQRRKILKELEEASIALKSNTLERRLDKEDLHEVIVEMLDEKLLQAKENTPQGAKFTMTPKGKEYLYGNLPSNNEKDNDAKVVFDDEIEMITGRIESINEKENYLSTEEVFEDLDLEEHL